MMDSKRDTLPDDPTFRAFISVDDCACECAVLEAGSSLSVDRVAEVMERLADTEGEPGTIVLDMNPEFQSRASDVWTHRRGLYLQPIRPGKPVDNVLIEDFNERFPEECLDQH